MLRNALFNIKCSHHIYLHCSRYNQPHLAVTMGNKHWDKIFGGSFLCEGLEPVRNLPLLVCLRHQSTPEPASSATRRQLCHRNTLPDTQDHQSLKKSIALNFSGKHIKNISLLNLVGENIDKEQKR